MFRSIFAAAFGAAVISAPVVAGSFNTLSGAAPQVIGHRGAPAYLPENTLGGFELALRMGADILEPDLQLTSDGAVVAMHDASLTRTTDVETQFAPRNGDFMVADFTLAEIRTLTVRPTGPASTTFPGFTPSMDAPFRVPTLDEVLGFVNAHNAATGDRIGVYPESKIPDRPELTRKIVAAMAENGFVSRDQNSYIQSFSHDGVREIARLQRAAGIDNAVVALGRAEADGDVFGVFDFTTDRLTSLSDLASFAQGVGVSLRSPALGAEFIAAAHALGLEVHGWTFRPTSLEAARGQFGFHGTIGMDAFFTDYPDFARTVLDE